MKKYILFYLLISATTIVDAKTFLKSSTLKNTTWTLTDTKEPKFDWRWDFSTSNLDSYFMYRKQRSSSVVYTYYLSPSISEDFNHSKVGKSSSGCYLHVYNTKLRESDVWEIESFDESQGVLTVSGMVHARKDSKIVLGRTGSITLKYKLIK